MLLREAERSRAAHRQSAEMRALDAERVHQANRIGNQCFEIVAAGGRIGFTVAALVVAQHAIGLRQIGRLRVPHVQVGGERIAQDEPGRALRSVDLVVDGDAVCFGLHRDVILPVIPF